MNRQTQIAQVRAFREMHHGPGLLLLPNAWDAVSAKLYEVEGFRAIGTTSAGIAAALGFADGEKMSLADNLTVCRRIVRAVPIPVSVDIEAGYSTSLAGLSETVASVIATGAVGINIEDSVKAGCGDRASGSLVPASAQRDRIAHVRRTADGLGVPIVINARTDALLGHGPVTQSRLDDAIERGRIYREAGADCVFVPDMGILDDSDIATLAAGIGAPLNLIAGEKTPGVRRLEALGVARLSFGPRPMRSALQFLRAMARGWLATGIVGTPPPGDALSYDEINAWFASRGPERPICDSR